MGTVVGPDLILGPGRQDRLPAAHDAARLRQSPRLLAGQPRAFVRGGTYAPYVLNRYTTAAEGSGPGRSSHDLLADLDLESL